MAGVSVNVMHLENFYLDILCTHSDWRRLGADTMLTEWGIKNPRKECAKVGVESSPMGLLF
jgi:hypothetical protein